MRPSNEKNRQGLEKQVAWGSLAHWRPSWGSRIVVHDDGAGNGHKEQGRSGDVTPQGGRPGEIEQSRGRNKLNLLKWDKADVCSLEAFVSFLAVFGTEVSRRMQLFPSNVSSCMNKVGSLVSIFRPVTRYHSPHSP